MYRIGIMDSGVGGLSVYREIVRLLPDAEYIYYSDNANCPYGDKSPEFVFDRARAITGLLISKGADIVVVACNTATAAAIKKLRAEFDIPFVGMEPAVKPAAIGTESGVVGVLATAGTLKGSLYIDTKGRFCDKVKVVEHVGLGFVDLVESGRTSGPLAREVVEASLRPLLDAGADTIVLGCTHYPFLLDTMRQIAGPGVRFIDPAPAVARRVLYMLKESEPCGSDSSCSSGDIPSGAAGSTAVAAVTAPRVELLSSGPDDTLRRVFASIG